MHAERKLGAPRRRIGTRGTILFASACLLLRSAAAFHLSSLHGPQTMRGALGKGGHQAIPMTWRSRNHLACLPVRRLRHRLLIQAAAIDAFDPNQSGNSTLKVVDEDAFSEVQLDEETQKLLLKKAGWSDEHETRLRDKARRIWSMLPSNDKLDKQIWLLTIPAVVNGLLLPIVGLIDAFYVAKLGDPLAFAAQGAANQVFSSTLGVLSFLPTVITPLVAAAHASGKTEEVQKHVGEGMFLSVLVGILGMCILLPMPQIALGLVLPAASMAYSMAIPYFFFRVAPPPPPPPPLPLFFFLLILRCTVRQTHTARCQVLGFIPSLISNVGFSSLRGTMDTVRPMQGI
eukprot:1211719-Rhodomonas_salina.1